MWRTVNADILLSELVPGDIDALVEHLAEKEISEQTLLIPYPYTARHAEEFLAWTAADPPTPTERAHRRVPRREAPTTGGDVQERLP
jgi:hypothetical protein